MKKIILCIITIIGVVMCMSPLLLAYADPMDPIQQIINDGSGVVTTAVGEGMLPNTPDGDNAVVSDAETTTITSTKTQKDWEAEEKQRNLVRIMDSVMLIAGVAGVIIPTIYMGIYLGARIFPPLFNPIFGFITRHKTNAEDIPWHIMFLRTIPVAILGMLLATGWLRNVLAKIWSFVLMHFLK